MANGRGNQWDTERGREIEDGKGRGDSTQGRLQGIKL